VPKLLTAAACLAASTSLAGPASPPSPDSGSHADTRSVSVVLDNARVRVFKTSTALAVADHPAAVVVVLDDAATRKSGDAYWSGDAGAAPSGGSGDRGSFLIVEPKGPASPRTPASSQTSATPPPVFIGMSFNPIFDNERVRVLRARMDVGAQEGFHTHGSDVVVVHLSGGDIEDTADGKTQVNHWKHGDVEFEARGSSHSARNLGAAVDVVLVALKP
jgi:quercetin dioxygenase-like cupin family protein